MGFMGKDTKIYLKWGGMPKRDVVKRGIILNVWKRALWKLIYQKTKQKKLYNYLQNKGLFHLPPWGIHDTQKPTNIITSKRVIWKLCNHLSFTFLLIMLDMGLISMKVSTYFTNFLGHH